MHIFAAAMHIFYVDCVLRGLRHIHGAMQVAAGKRRKQSAFMRSHKQVGKEGPF